MCTVVVRWQPDDPIPVQLLALRDELYSRPFDPPAAWWPDHAGVVGGRDRLGGGSWCVTDIASGQTAVVLNRPEKRMADPGGSSRGVLPLAAVAWGADWPNHVGVAPMAGFNLVLVTPQAMNWWSWDGADLRHEELRAGTHTFTPAGMRDQPLPERIRIGRTELDTDDLGHGSTEAVWRDWLDEVRTAKPSADRESLLVQKQINDESYETVFGQLIAARAGAVRLDYLNHVVRNQQAEWTTAVWERAVQQAAPADAG
jgi:hypothetical protein